MPISALPCKYGIGSLGEGAYRFVDFLRISGQKYWQVLPLVQTGYGDSPYQSVSDASGNPYFIDVEELHKDGLLTKRELQEEIEKSPRIDYGRLYETRYPLLRKAFSRFDVENAEFVKWCKSGKYTDYACFMALKQKYNAPFYEWPEEFKFRDAPALKQYIKENKNEILFWQFLQFEFYRQWKKLKTYANSKGIKIIGDLPLYVSADSVDVWTNPSLFMLDAELHPQKVAGVPPDYFCQDGQLWGNPVYDYRAHSQEGYVWWQSRLKHALTNFDYVRIDHFRGLDRFWAIDATAPNARDGEWMPAPGEDILSTVDTSAIIAEDLGTIDDGVRALLAKTGLPNMKVLQFAFGGDNTNPYLPWNVDENSVFYTGTHDNDTVLGFLESASPSFRATILDQLNDCLNYLDIHKEIKGKYAMVDLFIDVVYASRANVAIIPLHDVLALYSEYRINTPGTIGNWQVRYTKRALTDTAAALLKRKVRRFER